MIRDRFSKPLLLHERANNCLRTDYGRGLAWPLELRVAPIDGLVLQSGMRQVWAYDIDGAKIVGIVVLGNRYVREVFDPAVDICDAREMTGAEITEAGIL